jgi:hypothetical protein
MMSSPESLRRGSLDREAAKGHEGYKDSDREAAKSHEGTKREGPRRHPFASFVLRVLRELRAFAIQTLPRSHLDLPAHEPGQQQVAGLMQLPVG